MATADFTDRQIRLLRRIFAEWAARILGSPTLKKTPRLHRVPPIRRFELKASLSGQGPVSARFLYWDKEAEDWKEEELGHVFSLWNPFEIFSGDIGARGYCVYMLDSERWEIIQMEC